jgi:hypothetical protein
MSFDALVTGAIIRYPYLWGHELEKGETEGRKSSRPVAVGFRVRELIGNDILLLFPITSKKPNVDRFSVEIPPPEKRNAGLEADIRLWIVLDELNKDIIGKSYYLSPSDPIGKLSLSFLLPILRKVIARRDKIKMVNRVI